MTTTRLWTVCRSLCLAACWLSAVQPGQAQVRINELMASNQQTLLNAAGRAGDWIELANLSSTAVDLAGYWLSDDPNEPQRWQFPVDQPSLTVIPAHGFLLVWADDDPAPGELHAGFKLSANGEPLALFDPEAASLVDSVLFPAQQTDVSYGRHPDDASLWVFMDQPTPGQANASGFIGDVADTRFSVGRGFYSEPVTVAITSDTEGATIRYTLDGTSPVDSPTARTYVGPLTIDRTTCLRAYAFKPGWRPTNVDTQTYVFVADVIDQTQQQALAAGYPNQWTGLPADYGMDPEITDDPAYRDEMPAALTALPVVSVVTDPAYLFDAQTGIYTHPESEAPPEDPLRWERPVSVEFFSAHPEEDITFQVDCGLRLQGGHSRKPEKSPKHSFSLRFRGQYGPGQLQAKLFGPDWPVDRFDSLHLRAGFNNVWIHHQASQRERAQYVRDPWMRQSLTEMGHPDALQGRYVHLYLNGLYWGLYILQERPDADHYVAYHGGDPDLVDAINGDPTYVISDPLNTGSVSDGTIDAWLELKDGVASGDWAAIQQQLDVDQFIDWMLLNLFAGTTDIKRGTNWRAAGGGPLHRPWRFYAWDAEHVMESLNQQGIGPESDPSSLFEPLMTIPAFRLRFADRVQRHLSGDGALTPARTLARWRTLADQIESAVVAESARWGDYRRDVHRYQPAGPFALYTRDDFWLPERQWIEGTYLPARTAVVLGQLRNRGWLPAVAAPGLRIDGQVRTGGVVPTGAQLTFDAAGAAVAYSLDGNEPVQLGDTSGNREVLLVGESAAKRVWVPTHDIGTAWRQVGFDDSGWTDGTPAQSGGRGAVGYERGSGYESWISYDVEAAMSGQRPSCFVRIPFDLTAEQLGELAGLTLRLRYDDGVVAFLNGQQVAAFNAPGSLSYTSSATASHEADDWETVDLGSSLSRLQVGGNVLALHGLNRSTNSSDFLVAAELVGRRGGDGDGLLTETAQWAQGPVTLTHSVTVKARAYDQGQWSALSEAIFGVGPVAESLRITTLMYHPSEPNAEFIELTNIGGETLNLSGVAFTRGVSFRFAPLELAPGASVVVVEDPTAFAAAYGLAAPVAGTYEGRLANGSERLTLVDAVGAVILDFRYDDAWFPQTDGGGAALSIVEPQADPATWSDPAAWTYQWLP